MASVVLAETVFNVPWRDKGQRQVQYRFTLDDGTVHRTGVIFLGPERDVDEVRAMKGDELLARLAQNEIEELLR